MTPKEKALYLLNLSTLTNFEEAKKIALIVVDEILKSSPTIIGKMTGIKSNKKYWQQVKQEIEKL
jgi:hypothetical protein